MKIITRLIAVFAVLLLFGSNAYSQCTTATSGWYPLDVIVARTTSAPRVIATNAYAGEFSVVTVQVGSTYVVTSSVATDYITITNGTTAAVGTAYAFGVQPLTFTATSTSIRLYRHTNAACGESTADVDRTITITCSSCPAPPAPPANDACANANDLGTAVVTVAGTNVGATDEFTIDYAFCEGSFGNITDVWYKFTTNATGGAVTVTVNANTFDAVLAVYSGCTTASEVDCSDSPLAEDPEVLSLTSLSANTVYYIRIAGYEESEGTFNLGITGTALPLELKSFTGQAQGAANLLSWETLTEKNVQFHVVERSVDGARWSEVGRVNGKGDSQVAVKYSLEDKAPLARAYYRLRSVDFDGKENLSNSILLTRKGENFGITSVYPSPTTDNLTVQFNSTSEEKVTVRVMDMTGRLVREQVMEAVKDINELPIVLTGLQAGVYSVTVSNSTGVSTPMRFVKQ